MFYRAMWHIGTILVKELAIQVQTSHRARVYFVVMFQNISVLYILQSLRKDTNWGATKYCDKHSV